MICRKQVDDPRTLLSRYFEVPAYSNTFTKSTGVEVSQYKSDQIWKLTQQSLNSNNSKIAPYIWKRLGDFSKYMGVMFMVSLFSKIMHNRSLLKVYSNYV